jgi:DNA polymerase III subunit delta'
MMSAAPPLWAGIVGQASAVSLLQRALASHRVAHAYAFVGPSGVGRRLTAQALAQACLCPRGGCGSCAACRRVDASRHPDLMLFAPTPPRENPRGTPSLRIEQVRELEHWAALAPLEAPRKVFILDDADRLTEQAAEALLKTLEEPPPRTVVILILANPRALPPTVLSRCQIVRFRPLAAADVAGLLASRGVDGAAAGELARLVRGQPGLALGGADLAALQARRAAALEWLTVSPPALATRLDAAAVDRAGVAGCLETYWLWYRDALCLAAGADPTLLANDDRLAELRALADRLPLAGFVAAMRAIKEAWLALDVNVSPRLCLERALLALAPAPA